MAKFILFNQDGNLTSRYDSDIHSSIPVEALQVSDELFWQTINEQDGIWSLVEGEVVKSAFPAPTLSEVKAAKWSEVSQAFTSAMSAITSGYPSDEISSWAKQESEARAWDADNLAPTPLVDAISTAREIPKALLVEKIIEKADLFAGISGTFIGKRQKLEDQITAATTAEDVALISWQN